MTSHGVLGARVLFGLCALATMVGAQLPTQQVPSFRATIDRVSVDLIVLGADGAPLVDLRPDELALSVDGRTRAVESLDFIRLAPAAAEDIPASRAPSPFGSNLAGEAGRTIILVFDRDSYRGGGQKLVTDAAARFLDKLTSRDRVGLATLPYGKVEVDLTTQHDRIRKVLPTIVGYAYGPPSPQTAESRTSSPSSNTVPTGEPRCLQLYSLITFLGGITKTGGPKSIVFVAGGLKIAGKPDCLTLLPDLAKAADRARATFYVLQPTLFGSTDSGLGDLAGITGGVVLNPSGAMDPVFTRIARETSAYYALGFNSMPSERDGKSHSISLKVRRPRTTVQVRQAFTIEKDPLAAKTPPKTPVKAAPRDLLKDFNSHADVPMRAAAFAFRGASPTHLKIVVMAEAVSPATTIGSAAFGLYDAKGKNVAGWDADRKEIATRPLISATSLPPGSYRFRAALADEAGPMGAADYEFGAFLAAAGPYKLSSMMLGVKERDEFQPRLSFGREASVTAYFEIYANDLSTKAPVVVVETTRAGASRAGARTTATLTSRSGSKWIATAPIALADLASGDYVVRAAVTLNGTEIGFVVRTLRKTVY